MIRNLLLLSAFLFSISNLSAQFNNIFHFDIELGMNIGAPMTNIFEIPEGASGKPGIGFSPGISFEYPQNQAFSVGLGISYSQKGGKFISPVEGKYDVTRGIFGASFPIPIKVNYTGIVNGEFKNTYADFPVFINFHKNKWKFRLGYQFSKLLKSSLIGDVDVRALLLNFNDVQYDESANIKSRDHAVLIGAEYEISDRFSIASKFTYGLVKIMREELEEGTNPRNIFFYFMVKYRVL